MASSPAQLALRPGLTRLMKICLVSPYDLTRDGGVQAQVLGLAGWLRDQGDEVRIIAPRLPEDSDGVEVGRVVRVRANRSVAPICLSPRVSVRMMGTLAWGEVAHIHEPLMPMVGVAALRIQGPRVATFHADPPGWVRVLYRGLDPLVRSLKAPRTLVTAVSRQAAGALPSGWEPEEIVPNGVDTTLGGAGEDRKRGRVVFLGRDEPRKGLSLLLEAWPLVRSRHPHAELVVMGAERPEPPEGTVFLGRVDTEVKDRTLRSAEVYVAPNLGGESFGIVLVEALAAGCAVIASDLTSFRDVAGPAARYFMPGSVHAMVEQIQQVLESPPVSARLSEAGPLRAARFSWDKVGPAYRNCYERVIRRSA
ncbi:MAG: glycosyltransferase family 4 protein [bacterium]|nr:glycosyltransferase family 4 protein [bacterium]